MKTLFSLIVLSSLLVGCGKKTDPNYVQKLDDTDNKTTGQISGLALFTDHGTGCQYLGDNRGGLTPRMYPNGTQVCK